MTDPSTEESETEDVEELTMVLATGCVAELTVSGSLWLYWASGETIGVWTLWGGRTALSGPREPWIDPLSVSIGLVCIGIAALIVPTVRRWTPIVPRVALGASAFVVGLTLLPSVAVESALDGLVILGVVDSTVRPLVLRTWRLLFWNPWWILGVLSFCATAWLDGYTRQ